VSRKLQIGDKAPAFEAETYGGKRISLSEILAGGGAAICFYPRNNTPGCTLEACSIRDSESSIRGKGFSVIGVSIDSVKSHEGFRDKHNLSYTLVSDKEREIINLYGVASAANTALRVTFLVDSDGNIRHIWNKVDTRSHGNEILEKIEEISL